METKQRINKIQYMLKESPKILQRILIQVNQRSISHFLRFFRFTNTFRSINNLQKHSTKDRKTNTPISKKQKQKQNLKKKTKQKKQIKSDYMIWRGNSDGRLSRFSALQSTKTRSKAAHDQAMKRGEKWKSNNTKVKRMDERGRRRRRGLD